MRSPLTKRVLEVFGETDLMYVFNCSVALYTRVFNSLCHVACPSDLDNLHIWGNPT